MLLALPGFIWIFRRPSEVADPARETGGVLVRGLLVGGCGTDREIAEGAYGEVPSGQATGQPSPQGPRRDRLAQNRPGSAARVDQTRGGRGSSSTSPIHSDLPTRPQPRREPRTSGCSLQRDPRSAGSAHLRSARSWSVSAAPASALPRPRPPPTGLARARAGSSPPRCRGSASAGRASVEATTHAGRAGPSRRARASS